MQGAPGPKFECKILWTMGHEISFQYNIQSLPHQKYNIYIYIYIYIYINIYIYIYDKQNKYSLIKLTLPKGPGSPKGVHRDIEWVLGLATFPFEAFMVWLQAKMFSLFMCQENVPDKTKKAYLRLVSNLNFL